MFREQSTIRSDQEIGTPECRSNERAFHHADGEVLHFGHRVNESCACENDSLLRTQLLTGIVAETPKNHFRT